MGKSKQSKQRQKRGQSRTTQAEAERRFALQWRRFEIIEKLGKPAIVLLGVVASLYVGVYMPIEASHGETTTITFVANWLADLKVNIVLAWGAAGGCSIWAITERRKRLRERKERDDRIKKLEMKLDPNRTSSNLTTDGAKPRKAQDDE